MKRWCPLSILTDEVSQDLGAVIRFAQEFRLDGIELRSLYGKAFRDLSPAEIREVRQRCDDAGLRISGVATPVFKCHLDAPGGNPRARGAFQALRGGGADARVRDRASLRVSAAEPSGDER